MVIYNSEDHTTSISFSPGMDYVKAIIYNGRLIIPKSGTILMTSDVIIGSDFFSNDEYNLRTTYISADELSVKLYDTRSNSEIMVHNAKIRRTRQSS